MYIYNRVYVYTGLYFEGLLDKVTYEIEAPHPCTRPGCMPARTDSPA